LIQISRPHLSSIFENAGCSTSSCWYTRLLDKRTKASIYIISPSSILGQTNAFLCRDRSRGDSRLSYSSRVCVSTSRNATRRHTRLMVCHHVRANILKSKKSVGAHEDIIREKGRRYMVIYTLLSKNFGSTPNARTQAFPLTLAYTISRWPKMSV
jgi:hypothetical protein